MSDYITENYSFTREELLDFISKTEDKTKVPYSIQKVDGKDLSTYTDPIYGYSQTIPVVDEQFFIVLKERCWFQTSKVTNVETTEYGYLLTTLNSTYKVINLNI